jgi:hypothetical protein
VKPVFQTKFGLEGNCLAACVATILGYPIESVPIPAAFGSVQNRELNAWLVNRGLHYFESEVKAIYDGSFEDVVCIFTVESDTPEVRSAGGKHAVVGKWNADGKPVLIHDPRPDSDQAREIYPSAMGVFLCRKIAFSGGAR